MLTLYIRLEDFWVWDVLLHGVGLISVRKCMDKTNIFGRVASVAFVPWNAFNMALVICKMMNIEN